MAFGCGALTALAQETAEGQTAYAAQQGTWKNSSGKWWYAYNGGGYAKSGWAQIDGKWYLFDGAGWMKTGWQQVGGKWYHLSGSGAMQTGWLKDGKTWYYLNQSGAMATGWQEVGGSWYYLAKSGAMKTGWQKIGGSWYYLKGSGAMATKTWIGDYYVDGSGAMATIAGSGSTMSTRAASGIAPRTAARASPTRRPFIGSTTVKCIISPRTACRSKRSTGIHSGTIASRANPVRAITADKLTCVARGKGKRLLRGRMSSRKERAAKMAALLLSYGVRQTGAILRSFGIEPVK